MSKFYANSIICLALFFLVVLIFSCNPFSNENEKRVENNPIDSAQLIDSLKQSLEFILTFPASVTVNTTINFKGFASPPIEKVLIYIDDYKVGEAYSQFGIFELEYIVQNSKLNREVLAEAYLPEGLKLLTLTKSLDVTPLPASKDTNCLIQLKAAGISFSEINSLSGVQTPINVQMPIKGIGYRYLEVDSARTNLVMDCKLAMKLVEVEPYLKNHNIIGVLDLGVYNYRCIGGGTPPNCPSGVSEHAHAAAIDIAGFVLSDSTEVIISKDWKINLDLPTCDTSAGEYDSLLHNVVCQMHQDSIWANTLTPNYNTAHWNHFHLDLKEGDYFLKKLSSTTSINVDMGMDWH